MILAHPSVCPQFALADRTLAANAPGWVIVAEITAIQLVASCTVTLYVPILRATALSTVETLGDQV